MSTPPLDLLLRRDPAGPGRVWTAGPPAASGPSYAVGVRDGRIVALDDEAVALRGRGTEEVDLSGRMLLPGFQDAHVHAVFAGITVIRCDLAGLDGEEAQRRIVESATLRPEGWVLGGGWSFDTFGRTPTAADLDLLVGDRPVWLTIRDGHAGWASSRTLALAGIDEHTPDPADGYLERDEHGRPTGVLHEGAMDLVDAVLPPPSDEDYLAGLRAAQARLHSHGVTAWQDAILGDFAGWSDPTPYYMAAAADGTLTARVEGALWWRRGDGLEQVEEIVHRRATSEVGRFRTGAVKVMQDGIVENGTAAMLEPYLPHPDVCCLPGQEAGISMVDPQVLREAAVRLDAHGFTLHVHAIGDRAVREALDAIEAARRTNGRPGGRHHLAHIQVIHPDDVPRFAELDVTANLQALWATHEWQVDELCLPLVGEQRAAWHYPFGDMARSGARLAMGSDWFVSSPDPLKAVRTAVTRVAPSQPADTPPFLPEQAIDLDTALAAYTAGSAYVNRLDDVTGRLQVGMLADLAVLDRDLFAHPADEIHEARVDLTFVDGRAVHERPV
jgi:predicted amidohydrolase YtcJ